MGCVIKHRRHKAPEIFITLLLQLLCSLAHGLSKAASNRGPSLTSRQPRATVSDSESILEDGYTSDPEDKGYMLSISKVTSAHQGRRDKWQVELEVDGRSVPFHIDTGARCNVIVQDTTACQKMEVSRSHQRFFQTTRCVQLG
jgi:predicted aspartyl protease